MKVAGKVAIVTGGGGGIGGALAEELTTHGARVLVADLDESRAQAVADNINSARPGTAAAAGADVSDTTSVRSLIALAEQDFGPVDMYFANAGVLGTPGLEASDADWDRAIDVNLRAHIRAAQLLIPGWVERGEGYFVSTASAAGLLSQIGGATYAVTKHAAVGFAEWLSITYGDRGIRVSCLCPMGVNTELLYGGERSGHRLGVAATRAVTSAGAVLEPAQVARDVLAAIDEERFLILPHANVLDMFQQKASDYDRWLRGMRRYQASLLNDSQ
jgi:NAD(P)-dependent dehydrogenase (short-subunit alcohol dehydrogenase family)